MYTFRIQDDLKAYDEFICNNGGQYIQCSRWQNVKTTWACHYYGGFDEKGTQVLAALVMERSLPVAGKIWYASGGMICDYSNTALLEEFTAFIKGEMKKNGATCFITDPMISLRINGEDKEEGHNMHKVLTDMGYELNTSIENYTYKQPVQLFIPLRDGEKRFTAEEILKKCDKGVRYSIRIGEQRGLVAKTFTAEDIEKDPSIMDDFMAVMRDTSERDSFVERNGDYCLKLLKEFEGHSDLKLVYYDKELDRKLQAERLQKKEEALSQMEGAHEKKKRQLQEIIDSADKQTEHFEKRMAEAEEFTNDNRICVAGGLSIYYAGMGSCLFGGTRNVIRNNTRSSHYLNYLRLKESIARGCDIHDLGYVKVETPALNEDGTLGEMIPLDNFKGIYDFKKSFSSDYHEFIGEYVLVGNKMKYYSYAKLAPAARQAKIKAIKLLRR